jgi:hypothetical protein
MKFFDGPESLLMEDWERPSPSGRPVTTDVVARRLLAGALGIRLPKRDPEREKAEAMKLKLAKGIIVSLVTKWSKFKLTFDRTTGSRAFRGH